LFRASWLQSSRNPVPANQAAATLKASSGQQQHEGKPRMNQDVAWNVVHAASPKQTQEKASTALTACKKSIYSFMPSS
jgi:hypothetical protein